MAKDNTNVMGYENIYKYLTYEEYLRKREELNIPDDLIFTENRE